TTRALGFATLHQRVDVGDLDLEQLFNRRADLDLVRAQRHLKHHLVCRRTQLSGFLRHGDRTPNDLFGVHACSPVDLASLQRASIAFTASLDRTRWSCRSKS